MPTESPIYIKLDYDEAVQSQRGLLYSELNSLRIIQKIERYKAIRMEELALKTKFYSKMKEAKLNMKRIQELIPVPTIPRILKRIAHIQLAEKKQEKEKKGNNEEDVESDLRQIQRRLEDLQRRTR